MIYPKHDAIAREVVKSFKNRNIITSMVLTKTQSGKTDSMCATIRKYLEDYETILSVDNLCTIKGYSSSEWNQQTEHRLPDCLANKVSTEVT